MGLKLSAGMMVALDTAPLIYWIEKHPKYFDALQVFFDSAAARSVQMVTSMVTYIEVLTLPERLGRHDLTARYRMFLGNSEQLAIYPLNVQVADDAIRYRARYGFKTPDAIQLAVAKVCGVQYFLTSDAALKTCEEVPVVLVSEL